jgi:4-amino-4-deoxy-L-arabinose transferase-like glycosyltransferase
MIKWLKRKEHIILVLLLLLAAFLRLYRIDDYMTFLGDEGRDALVVKHILEGDFTLLGPRASAGDFFTGPIYYYFMAPFLWLFRLDPVGPAVMIALLGIITVFLTYWLGKYFFNEKAGLFAAALYTVSPLVITYSRSSWNPNPMPFFSLIILFTLYKAVRDKSLKLFLTSGVLYGIALQLHYIELFLGVIIAFFILLGSLFFTEENKKNVNKMQEKMLQLVKSYMVFFGGFLIGFSLFLIFEIRHGFPNLTTIFKFIFSPNLHQADIVHTPFFEKVWDVFFRLFSRLTLRYPTPDKIEMYDPNFLVFLQVLTVVLAVLSIIALFRIKNRLTILLFVLWLGLGVTLFGFYRKPVYDYYFQFMFPLPFLLLGNLLSMSFDMSRWRKLFISIAFILFGLLFIYNFPGNPLTSPANHQKDQMKTIAEFVLSKTDGKPYNFALITPGNSDHAYRYFFELANHEPVEILNPQIDPERKSVTGQLLIVCEDVNCKPLGHSLWEVAGFGRAEIAGAWDVSVVKVYKLVPYKGDNK